MKAQELKDLIITQIAGQGTQVDLGGKLPEILNGILGIIGDVSELATEDKSNIVDALNEVKDSVDAIGEQVRIRLVQMSLDLTVPSIMQDIPNTSIPKFSIEISGEEAEQYQICGMTAYEVFDAAAGGNRLNFIPVCQFTESNQTKLTIRGMVAGSESKTARRISCWVLLKRRPQQ